MKQVDFSFYSPPDEEYPLITRTIEVDEDTEPLELQRRIDAAIEYIFIGRLEEYLGRAPQPEQDIKKLNIRREADPTNTKKQVTLIGEDAILWIHELKPRTKAGVTTVAIQYRRMGK